MRFTVFGNYGPLGSYPTLAMASEAVAIFEEDMPHGNYRIQYESDIGFHGKDDMQLEPMTADNIQLTHKG